MDSYINYSREIWTKSCFYRALMAYQALTVQPNSHLFELTLIFIFYDLFAVITNRKLDKLKKKKIKLYKHNYYITKLCHLDNISKNTTSLNHTKVHTCHLQYVCL